ncbi:hypothetical protein [Micromonospora sp. NPDC000207]|uniref:hypothetical protein n=1 Tax=unclassified Micromonospora TaxID=2617518 RepID=UPI00332F3DC8
MYAWIWRKLPFGVPGKLVGSLLLATATVYLLWAVVFPWAEPLLPFDDVQVEQPAGENGGPGGGDPDLPGQDAPSDDDHDLPYDTDQNNTPPSDRER